MPLILVVEQEGRYIERIHDALAAEGWSVKVVNGHAEALRAAASEGPDMVLVSTEVPESGDLLASFSRRNGGPGTVALVAEAQAGAVTSQQLGADEALAKPFTDQQLRLTIRRGLSAAREAPAQRPGADGHKLTAEEIFGDVVAEVESALGSVEPVQAPRAPSPTPMAPSTADDIERKLEQTLSGVIKLDRRPSPSPTASAKGPSPGKGTAEVDALISRTLSGLDLGGKASRSAKPPPRSLPDGSPPAAAAPPLVATAPPPAVSSLGTSTSHGDTPVAGRKSGGTRGGIDLADLEELARPKRRAEPGSRPGVAVAPVGSSPHQAERRVQPPPPAPPPRPTPAAAEVAASPAPLSPPRPVVPEAPSGAPRSVSESPFGTQRVAVVKPPADAATTQEFGQYTLLERIAVGGMAEVWKARMKGVEGFQKTVAIKKILPHLTDNADFVSMFVDEAKLAAQLNHTNIIHIYDLGKIGEDYYIAMEYVEGKNLRAILNTARRREAPLPIGLSLLVTSRLASALDYAHRKRDFDDRELGLVHRDVSPQNVLISYEGDIKLCDFGIVKAVSKASHTQMGALKGKLQYMSPEQAWGKQVDGRSDIFSLGALLFEMLTARRLFHGDNEISVLEAVRECRVEEPRTVRPDLPPEVNALVIKALAKEPGGRFHSAGEMHQELERLLHALKPTPSQADLAAYMSRLADGDAVAAAAGREVPSASGTPASRPQPAAVPAASASPASAPPSPAPRPPIPAPLATGGDVAPVEAVGEVRMEESERRGRGLLVAAILALLLIAVVLYFILNRPRGQSSPPAPSGTEEGAPASAEAAAGQAGPPPAGSVEPGPPGPADSAPTAAPVVPDHKAEVAKTAKTAPQQGDASAVDAEVARREKELKEKLDGEQRRLEKQLADAKGAHPAEAQSTQPSPPATPPAVPVPVAQGPAKTPAESAPEQVPVAAVPSPPSPLPAATAETAAPPEHQAPERRPPPVQPQEAPAPPQVKVGQLVDPGPGVVAPVLVSIDKPQYPPIAEKLRVEGVVEISVLVDENGQVQQTRLTQAVKQDVGLNEAALRAARSARFRPATKDGVRVKMWAALKIPFRL